MKNLEIIIIGLTFFSLNNFPQSWQYIGPDSTNWQNIIQIDVSFNETRIPYISAATTKGLVINTGNLWCYVQPDWYDDNSSAFELCRAFYFSPFNDSVGFLGFNIAEPTFGEQGSYGKSIMNIYDWFYTTGEIGFGWIGFSPSLLYKFSPHNQNYIYAWIINFYKSTDGGLNWEVQNQFDSYGAVFLSVDQTKDSVLYAGMHPFSDQEGIYRSTNDGTNWEFVYPFDFEFSSLQRSANLISLGDTLIFFTNRFPQSPNSSCGIFISTDYGISWTCTLPGINVQQVIYDPNNINILYAATEKGIYNSTDTGFNWELFNNALPSIKLVDIRKDTFSDTLYVAASDAGIYKIYGSAVEVNDIQRQVSFKIYQNYPNPFNPTTTIAYSLSDAAQVNLIVFNVIGEEIKTLVNTEQSPGDYNIVWDGKNNFNQKSVSGIYIYKLIVSEKTLNFSASKKMILLK